MKHRSLIKSVITLTMACTFFSCQKSKDLSVSNEPSTQAPTLMAGTSCSAPGWASQNGGTIGGDAGAVTIVNTYATLKAAILNTSVKVIQVDGTITIPSAGRISFQDQTGKTIYGSSGAKLVSADQTASNSGIIYIKRCTNIIIRNLIFEGPGAYDTDGWDNATLDDCSNVWVDHCEFRDGVDGNFDIKNKTDYVTVSYCKFAYLKPPTAGGSGGSDDHRFSNLIGSSDGATADAGHLNITFVRCWWAEGCVERLPRVRFGKVHVLNNYYNSTVSKNCVQAGYLANLLIEANVFENVKNPINLMANNSTAVQSKNNVFTNITGTNAGNGVTAFTPPYTITTVTAAAAKTLITASNGAGATLTGNTCTSF